LKNREAAQLEDLETGGWEGCEEDQQGRGAGGGIGVGGDSQDN